MSDYKKESGNKGCMVEDGIGCHYKSYEGWCVNCKTERRKPKGQTWGERAIAEQKYIKVGKANAEHIQRSK
jgi:hypothetical protein